MLENRIGARPTSFLSEVVSSVFYMMLPHLNPFKSKCKCVDIIVGISDQQI